LYKDNNGILNEKNFDNKPACALCGRIFEKKESIEEKIDGYEYLFDSEDCISIFKKLANLYGDEFKNSISDEDIYDPIWGSVITKEQEFGKMKNRIDSIENETFQIIRDPIRVQELAFKLV